VSTTNRGFTPAPVTPTRRECASRSRGRTRAPELGHCGGSCSSGPCRSRAGPAESGSGGHRQYSGLVLLVTARTALRPGRAATRLAPGSRALEPCRFSVYAGGRARWSGRTEDGGDRRPLQGFLRPRSPEDCRIVTWSRLPRHGRVRAPALPAQPCRGGGHGRGPSGPPPNGLSAVACGWRRRDGSSRRSASCSP
jgi:hypothetical protein